MVGNRRVGGMKKNISTMKTCTPIQAYGIFMKSQQPDRDTVLIMPKRSSMPAC